MYLKLKYLIKLNRFINKIIKKIESALHKEILEKVVDKNLSIEIKKQYFRVYTNKNTNIYKSKL
jgi:hypothetical protein